MARTNDRTQMLIGMILDEVQTFLDGFTYYMEKREERWTHPDAENVNGLYDDGDLAKAHKIVQDLIKREATKNPNREAGSWVENITEAGPEIKMCRTCGRYQKTAEYRPFVGYTCCIACFPKIPNGPSDEA